MTNSDALPILRRTGVVLVVIGVLDIAAMIYCITQGIAYSSSLNIFAVVAGIFLFRGSLAAAAIVRWSSAFALAAFATILFIWPVIQPPNLVATMIRLNPGAASITALFLGGLLLLFYWLQRELGRQQIQSARIEAGRKAISIRTPASVGAVFVVALTAVLSVALNGQAAAKAKSLALQQLGPGYKFHVSSLALSTRGKVTSVSAKVTAWNDNEIQTTFLQWAE